MYYIIHVAAHWTKCASSVVRLFCNSSNFKAKCASSVVRLFCNSSNFKASIITGQRRRGEKDLKTESNEQVEGEEKDKNTVSIQRVITQDDLKTFSQLTGDHNPIHFATQGRSVVHGALLNSLVSGVIGTKLPGPGTVVVSQTLRFPTPCYVDDNVIITVKITSSRKIITCKYECSVEGGKIVMDGEARLVQNKQFSLVDLKR